MRRLNNSGQVEYRAQIRLRRKRAVVYQESQSFDRKQVARAWMTRRQAELAQPGALDSASRKAVPFKKIIERYLEEYERIRPLGKTEHATLSAISETWLGEVLDKRADKSEIGRIRAVAHKQGGRRRASSDCRQ